MFIHNAALAWKKTEYGHSMHCIITIQFTDLLSVSTSTFKADYHSAVCSAGAWHCEILSYYILSLEGLSI